MSHVTTALGCPFDDEVSLEGAMNSGMVWFTLRKKGHRILVDILGSAIGISSLEEECQGVMSVTLHGSVNICITIFCVTCYNQYTFTLSRRWSKKCSFCLLLSAMDMKESWILGLHMFLQGLEQLPTNSQAPNYD